MGVRGDTMGRGALLLAVVVWLGLASCGSPLAQEYSFQCEFDVDCADGFECFRCPGHEYGECVHTVERGCGPGEYQDGNECRPICSGAGTCRAPGTACRVTEDFCVCE